MLQQLVGTDQTVAAEVRPILASGTLIADAPLPKAILQILPPEDASPGLTIREIRTRLSEQGILKFNIINLCNALSDLSHSGRAVQEKVDALSRFRKASERAAEVLKRA